jgi:hypothetical protein
VTSIIKKLVKVNESFTINRYDNGFMIEVSGKDSDGNWKTCKTLCSTEDELIELVREVINMDLDN